MSISNWSRNLLVTKLESGRHIAICRSRISNMVAKFSDYLTSNEKNPDWKLIAIEQVKDLYPYFEILNITDRDISESGLTVSDVLSNRSDWSEEEKMELTLFLESNEFINSNDELISFIEEIRQHIRTYGTPETVLTDWGRQHTEHVEHVVH